MLLPPPARPKMPAHRGSAAAASVEPSALTDRRSISVTPLDDDDLVDGKAKFAVSLHLHSPGL